MNIRFYKTEEDKWYADLPRWIEEGGSVEELEMVSGADVWLDVISCMKKEITLQIDTQRFKNFTDKLLYIGDCPDHVEGTYITYPEHFDMWLCGVTKWLFGNYPQAIYYKIVKL